jgi:hypothetical protein
MDKINLLCYGCLVCKDDLFVSTQELAIPNPAEKSLN